MTKDMISFYNWSHPENLDYDAAIEMGFDEPPKLQEESPFMKYISKSPAPTPTVSNSELGMPPQPNNDTQKSIDKSTQKKNTKVAIKGQYIRPDDYIGAQREHDLGLQSLANGSPLDFMLPQYGVADFITDRALWQKGIHNLSGEPGWFYFKLFFNFHDVKGLFGGVMEKEIPITSALRYLYGVRQYYKSSKIYDRILALARFTYTLSYINSISPWFFIGINGANKLNALNLNDLVKENSIDILCNGDAVDMRLSTLLDMYRYACYDDINQKEIIPENLRKFDMSIVIMNVPIKYFQTAIMASEKVSKIGQIGHNSTILNKAITGINKIAGLLGGSNATTFDYKNTNGNNNGISNMLSFQMYSLKNCEIDPISFEGYVPSGMNNSQFYKQGTGSIKIKYDRCYKHTFNEWTQMFYGSTGIHYDKNAITLKNQHQDNLLGLGLGNVADKFVNAGGVKGNSGNNDARLEAIKKSIYNSFFDKDADVYKGLIDFSEMVIQDSLINVKDPEYLGNISEDYDETNWEDRWNKTKDNVKKFFTNPLDIF